MATVAKALPKIIDKKNLYFSTVILIATMKL